MIDNAVSGSRFVEKESDFGFLDAIFAETPLTSGKVVECSTCRSQGIRSGLTTEHTPKITKARALGVLTAAATVAFAPTIADSLQYSQANIHWNPTPLFIHNTEQIERGAEGHLVIFESVTPLQSDYIISSLDTSSNRALQAVSELQEWLNLSASEVTKIGRFARRNLSNWQRGKGSYGASSRHLFAVHALVSQLVIAKGRDWTFLWLHSPYDSTATRLERISQGTNGLRDILDQASPIVFPETVPSSPIIDLDETDQTESMLNAGERAPDRFAFSPVRTRRLS